VGEFFDGALEARLGGFQILGSHAGPHGNVGVEGQEPGLGDTPRSARRYRW
jgi:hypothetical protein